MGNVCDNDTSTDLIEHSMIDPFLCIEAKSKQFCPACPLIAAVSLVVRFLIALCIATKEKGEIFYCRQM